MSPAVSEAAPSAMPLTSIADRVEIAPGVMIPRLGLGTSRAFGRKLTRTILSAIELGYRLIDTSANYMNESEVGAAIARASVPREEIFVTTKLEGSDQGYNTTPRGLQGSLRRLRLDYVDLYIIHWPNASLTNDTWRALEELLDAGLTRAIGVSNFEISDLEQLRRTANVPPALNQIEFNPLVQRRQLHAYCREHAIPVEAWHPILKGRADQVRELVEIGQRHSKTAAQVCLRWLLQQGVIAIPKTVHEDRLRENVDLYGFELSAEEMAEIDALER